MQTFHPNGLAIWKGEVIVRWYNGSLGGLVGVQWRIRLSPEWLHFNITLSVLLYISLKAEVLRMMEHSVWFKSWPFTNEHELLCFLNKTFPSKLTPKKRGKKNLKHFCLFAFVFKVKLNGSLNSTQFSVVLLRRKRSCMHIANQGQLDLP